MNAQHTSSDFAPTRWTLVLRAGCRTVETAAALQELCDAYYHPVFGFVCRSGHDEETARDLTHSFFAAMLQRGELGAADPARGRFRSYLLGAVKHFLSDQRDHQRRLKRGGGALHASLDEAPGAMGGAEGAAVSTEGAPDTYFDRQWALTVMSRALDVLRQECAAKGKAAQFEALKPWLVGETDQLSQADAAARLQWTETAVKVAVHRMRRRLREAVRAEISQTLGDGADLEGELRYLVDVLARS